MTTTPTRGSSWASSLSVRSLPLHVEVDDALSFLVFWRAILLGEFLDLEVIACALRCAGNPTGCEHACRSILHSVVDEIVSLGLHARVGVAQHEEAPFTGFLSWVVTTVLVVTGAAVATGTAAAAIGAMFAPLPTLTERPQETSEAAQTAIAVFSLASLVALLIGAVAATWGRTTSKC